MGNTASNFPHWLIEWFENRTLSIETLGNFGISTSPMPVPNALYIVIPIFDADGNFLFNKYRRDPRVKEDVWPNKYTYDKGGRISLYGAHKIKDANRVVLCEGELDALCLWSHGIPAVSSTGGAGPFDPRWADLLAGKEIIICYDNDEAGSKGAVKALSYLPDAKVVIWPTLYNVKDLTDYCIRAVRNQKDIKDELERLFQKAENFNIKKWDEGNTLSDKKFEAGVYRDHIKLIRDARFRHSYDNLTTTFADTAIAYLEGMLTDVDRDIKRLKNKNVKAKDKSIESAKEIPITNFIKFNHQDMAPCIFHNEKTASMHYIKHSNKVYCFGCNKVANVIEVVMQLQGLTFGQALNKLL